MQRHRPGRAPAHAAIELHDAAKARRAGCPERCPSRARWLVEIDVDCGPMSSFMNLRLSTNRARTHWFLWLQFDPMDQGWVREPVAWMPRAGVSVEDAVYRMTVEWLRLMKEIGWDEPPSFSVTCSHASRASRQRRAERRPCGTR